MPPHYPQNSNSSDPESGALDVYFLGCVDFEATELLQQKFTEEIEFRRDLHGKLLICEHPPLISVGREGSHADLRYSDVWLTENHEDRIVRPSLEVRWVKRGGGALVHAPGQLAIYPVIPYTRQGFNVVEYRDRLMRAVTRACEESRIAVECRKADLGLFTRHGQVGFVGLSCRDGIISRGMYLNVAAPLELLRQAHWSMENDSVESGRCTEPANLVQSRRVSISAIRERVLYHVQNEFGYERSHLYTSHPLLRRVSRKVYEYA
ncbi:MAG: hypothetical protein O2955_08785 [Planctomycetota bacterium]|nr:hypothetical protein [Planctomycetota bacterium]MDA1212601.1 hypothetical protein [Planctomycetota bacterium]